ncbi:ATP-dependent helicase [Streptomyces mobaraensis NBRC 13819 = DSM 40847]|nr:DEAD/DEAH box helicase [Streptomyces mobaraensis]QTT73878.1 ATP-dependent helicase [Streptomyces mobaraensis NBRC 13819 = DSM 40847]
MGTPEFPGRLQATFVPDTDAPGCGAMAFWGTPDPVAEAATLGLPAAAGTAGPRLPALATLPTLLPHRGSLVDVDVPALLVPVGEAVGALAALATGTTTGIATGTTTGTGTEDDAENAAEVSAPDRPLGHSVHAWAVAARLALEHVTAGHLVPVLREAGEGLVRAHWRAATDGDPRLAALAAALPAAAHALRVHAPAPMDPPSAPAPAGTDAPTAPVPPRLDAPRTPAPTAVDAPRTPAPSRTAPPSTPTPARINTPRTPTPTGIDAPPTPTRVWSAPALLSAFCDAVADACARAAAPTAAAPTAAPPTWTTALVTASASPALPTPTAPAPGLLADWALAGSGDRAAVRLLLRLGTPAGPDALWPLSFHLEAVDEPGALVSAHRVWETGSAPLSLGGRVLDGPQEALVEGLGRAARVFRPLAACLEESRPTRVLLNPFQAARLFGDTATALRTAGIGLTVPDELSGDEPDSKDPTDRKSGNALLPRLRVGTRRTTRGKSGKSTTPHPRTVTYRWEAVVGDEVVTPDEVALLASRGEPLAPWRNTWVRLDPDRIGELAALVGTSGRLSTAEALAIALCGRHHTEEFGEVAAVADGSVADLVGRLREAGGRTEPDLTGVRADLRDYQRRGVAWLQSLTDLGFGALLADDMGLGKTLQTIALLAGRTGDRPRLVVCPTSVVSNWERELARFAPGLTVVRHHGARRATEPAAFPPGAVVVTSYALLRLDTELLASVGWDLVVLDEAQQIKNHTAQTARAALRLEARARVALTGTPVENRLSELWSIAHFANPGLLGSHRRFRERFAGPIERDGDREAAERLRAVVSPFVLRRMKSAVVDELPAKLETTVPCDLTAEQTRLYRAAVADALDGDDGLGTGVRRQGNVLRLLTHLKQICNHPVQYLGEDPASDNALAGRSGKLMRATEMLGEAVAAGDRALVFTQYRVMGELLARHLAAELGLDDVPFLHGGTPAERRDAMVDAFQHDDTASPLLIVSLKAGGFGLNLTRASHVLHYDRWWNPAVEDQATDRAHRIGQTKTVHVHKLVTADTFEERIDALLESKRSLADSVVGTSETWLSELDDDALRALVRLADSEESTSAGAPTPPAATGETV